MSRQSSSRINVPDELREVLLEFTISYLLEEPPDVLDYAVEFFTKLKESRKPQIVAAPSTVGSVVSNEDDDDDGKQ